MSRRRWIADEVSGDRAALTGAHAAHLARALRVHPGQEFEVMCGNKVRHAIVANVSDERGEFDLYAEVLAKPTTPIVLLLAVFKFDRLEWAIEKCTELNVTSVVPVIARRTEKHLAHAAGKRVERWRRIAGQASEQARRVAAPDIAHPMKLLTALTVASDLRLVLDETEREVQLSTVLRERTDISSLAIAIGPEGGWTPDELLLFSQTGWISVSLGMTILRAETAAIAAMAITRGEIG